MIKNGYVTESGNLIFNLEDDTTLNVGNVRGIPGPQGENGSPGLKGDPGESGLVTTVTQNTVVIEATTTNPSVVYTTQNCSYTDFGDRIRLKYKIGWSSSTLGSGSYLVSLPFGVKFNTTKDPLFTGIPWSPSVDSMASYLIPVTGNYVYSSNWSRTTFAVPYDSDRFRIIVDNNNASGLNFWSSSWAVISSGSMLFNFEFDIWK